MIKFLSPWNKYRSIFQKFENLEMWGGGMVVGKYESKIIPCGHFTLDQRRNLVQNNVTT